ncbi:head maturation protease, ClpP-related [Piscirickettsia salmonis]|nr:head maturation protease, ClpP-related [Piscirickettsia salmonis]PEQ17711.1 Clp protease [Piscirickettsia salmonis]WGZ73224.1 Clp protease ClpP [Piscirickettsia salmonis]
MKSKIMNNWYQIKAQANKHADVYIYDYIGDYGVEAKRFVMELQALDVEQINLRINSPGGSVTDGFAIYNALHRHPAKIIAHIDSLAASMASIIALTGETVHMADNAFYMIHRPWAYAVGDAEELSKIIEILDKNEAKIVNIYHQKSNLADDKIKAMMYETSWLTAAEAKEYGFIDEITEAVNIAAYVKPNQYKNTPQTLIKHSENNTVNALQRHKLALKRSLL